MIIHRKDLGLSLVDRFLGVALWDSENCYTPSAMKCRLSWSCSESHHWMCWKIHTIQRMGFRVESLGKPIWREFKNCKQHGNCDKVIPINYNNQETHKECHEWKYVLVRHEFHSTSTISNLKIWICESHLYLIICAIYERNVIHHISYNLILLNLLSQDSNVVAYYTISILSTSKLSLGISQKPLLHFIST